MGNILVYLNLSCNVGVQMCDMGLPLGRSWGFVSALRSATAIITGTFSICLLSLLQWLCCCCCYLWHCLFAALLAQLIGKLLQFEMNWNGDKFDDNCESCLNRIRSDMMWIWYFIFSIKYQIILYLFIIASLSKQGKTFLITLNFFSLKNVSVEYLVYTYFGIYLVSSLVCIWYIFGMHFCMY